jgi:SPP1 family predicted phage head-tail adaptor
MSWPGDARTWFALQAPSGANPDGYATQATVPGAMRAAAGNEVLQFGGQMATGQVVIRIRYRLDVRADWRLLDTSTGRPYQIAGYADPDGRRQFLVLQCVGAQ